MAKELKRIIVDSFKLSMADVDNYLLVNYQGLNAEQTVDLRGRLRKAGARMRVVHNRLFKRALAERELGSEFYDLFRGPVAILYGEDTPAASKVLEGWNKENKGVAKVRGALFEGRVLGEDDVAWLSSLPDKPTLQAQVSAHMLSPLGVLASAANSLVSHFAGCVEARRKELEDGGS